MSLYSNQRLLKREVVLLREVKKAAGEWRRRSLMPKPPFLMEACARSDASCVLSTWVIPPGQNLREVCILRAQRRRLPEGIVQA